MLMCGRNAHASKKRGWKKHFVSGAMKLKPGCWGSCSYKECWDIKGIMASTQQAGGSLYFNILGSIIFFP